MTNSPVTYSKHRKATLEVKPRQTDHLNDPRYGLQSLLECLFHEARSTHLTKVAEQILLLVKANGPIVNRSCVSLTFLDLSYKVTYQLLKDPYVVRVQNR